MLDVGDGVSHVVPVYEGFALGHAIQRVDVAGRDVTENMMLQLRRQGHVFHTSAEKEIVLCGLGGRESLGETISFSFRCFVFVGATKAISFPLSSYYRRLWYNSKI